MALTDLQRALASLYTDARTRRSYAEDPSKFSRDWKLSESEFRALSVSADSVEGFAAALRDKRMGEVFHLLPATARALGAQARDLFREFFRHDSVDPKPSARRHAIRFSRFVADRFSNADPPRQWLCDLARYETAPLLLRERPWPLVVRVLRHSWPELLQRMDAPSEFYTRPRGWVLGLWWRRSDAAAAVHYSLAWPIKIRHKPPPTDP